MTKPKTSTKAKKGDGKKPSPPSTAPISFQYLVNPKTGERDIAMGPEYDIHAINREYKKLKCPADVFDPTTLPLDKDKDISYFILTSSRSVGKTTSCILWGMCYNKLYSSPGQSRPVIYVRQREAMIERRYLDNTVGLFSVIRQYHYVEKLTEGRWNNVEYYARAWRYVNTDDTGKVIEKAKEAFMICIDVDQSETYKSTLSTLGDVIIYDEFISKQYRENEWLFYLDTQKTCFRDRLSPIAAFFLANTTDPYSPYLREMLVQKEIQTLSEGDSCIVQTRKGTKLYCERIGAKNAIRPLVNTKWYGFDNPMINSIVGGGGWNIAPYPHIWSDETRQVIQKGICLVYQDNIVELEICTNEGMGLHICAHPLRRLPDDSKILTIYTLEVPRTRKEVYGFGPGRPIDKFIFDLYENNKWLYSGDDTGTIVEHYIDMAK